MNIRQFLQISFLIAGLAYSPLLQAAKSKSLPLDVSHNLSSNICTSKKWNQSKVFWAGSHDLRPVPAIATESKKGQVQKRYQTPLELNKYFDEFIPEVLDKCGVQLVANQSEADFVVRAHIKKFHAQMDRTLVKSNITAESQLIIKFDSKMASYDVQIGFLLESKSANFQNRKRLQTAVSELFSGTLNEMITSNQIKFLN